MTNEALQPHLDAIYTSLENNNENIDTHIAALKRTMAEQNMPSVEIDSSRLAQPNRQGRKLMQSYFKKRGVELTFKV